jgi:hypothetical protein
MHGSAGWKHKTVFDSLSPTEKRIAQEYLQAKSSGRLRDFKNKIIKKYGHCKYDHIVRTVYQAYRDRRTI